MLPDFFVGLAISFLVNWLCRPWLQRAGWVDIPTSRKLHARPTVISGGLGLFCALAFGIAIFHSEATSAGLYLSAVAVMFAAGFLDDRSPIRARYRLAVQIVASLALVVGTGTVIRSFEIAPSIDLASIPLVATFLSAFWMVGLINSINMSDGSDGVAGGYGAIAIVGLLVFYYLSQSSPHLTNPIAFSTILLVLGGIVAFLCFNYPLIKGRPALAFMGDGGSMLLGIVVGWAILKAGLQNTSRPLDFWYAIWLVALPAFDATYCILRRVLGGSDPLTPDRRHLHHLLQGCGLSTRSIALSLHATAIALTSLGLLLWYKNVPPFAAFWIFALSLGLYSILVTRLWSTLDRTPIMNRMDQSVTAGPD